MAPQACQGLPAAGQGTPRIASVQPGGGPLLALELWWGRLRRACLRRLRPRWVARWQALRQGECPGCPHDVLDPRDLKLVRNVCGIRFAEDPFAWRGRLGLARQGLVEVLVHGAACALLTAVALAIVPWLAPLPVLGLAFLLWFFRDPERAIPEGPGLIVAPADGTVDDLAVLPCLEPLGGPVLRIGIFLSLLSVHVNRVPTAGRVLAVRYQPGQRRATYRVGELEANEQMWTLLEAEDGRRLAVRQIAGPAARRIVHELRPGERVERGARFGMIKLGSRTELYLPYEPGLEVSVRLADRVRGGVTVLARQG